MKKITLFLAFTCILIGSTALSQNNFFTQDITPATTRTFNSIYFTDVDNGWAAGDIGSIYNTTDGGTTWTSQTNEMLNDRITLRTLNSIFFINDMKGWAAGNSGIILHTTDGGSTWIAQKNISNVLLDGGVSNLYSIFFIDNMKGWAAGLNGFIYQTTDGGTTWTSQSMLSSQILYSIFFTDNMKGWATGLGGKIFYTSNGGSVWTPQTSGTTSHLHSIYFIGDNGWATGASGTILRTINEGTNWAVQTSGTRETLNSIFFTDASNGWVAGNSGTILRTTDGGINWATHTQTSNISQNLKSIFLIDSSNGWVAGTNGTILHTNKAPQITLPASFTGDGTASKIPLTASQVSTNVSSWNRDDTAANIVRMIDSDTSTDAVVDDFAIHPLSADGKHITFTLNEKYNKGEFKYYNRTRLNQGRVNGSTVQFFNGDTSEYSETILSAGILVTITPPDGIIFDKVVITFSGDRQNFREIEIHGDRLNIKSVEENQTTVATLIVTDTDTDNGDSPKFSTIIAGEDALAFALTARGVLTFNANPDYENPANTGSETNKYEITVKAVDGNGGIDTQDITIIVTNVDIEAPTGISLSSTEIANNAGANQEVGTFSTTDPETNSGFTYTLVAGAGDADNEDFNIQVSSSPSSSSLILTGSPDILIKSTYLIRVNVNEWWKQ